MTREMRFLELFGQGFARAGHGDLAGANELYEQALSALGDREHPQLTALLTNLAQNALALDQPDAGWRYFDRALTRALDGSAPVTANTWHQFAWILYERGELPHAEQALELIERALAGEDRLEMQDTKMRILLKLGRTPEARRVAVAALRRDFHHRDFQDIKVRFGLTSQVAVAAAERALRGGGGSARSPRRPAPAIIKARSLSSRPPRAKRIDELREWKGRRPAAREPVLDLTPQASTDSPRARAQEALRTHLRQASWLESSSTPLTRATLSLVAADAGRGPYVQLDAALGLALLGDERAVSVLRRVLSGPRLSGKSAQGEQGLAALGLALLRQSADLPRIRSCTHRPESGIHIELAIQILEGV